MSEPVRGRDGKFAGSIGKGKTNVPTPSLTSTMPAQGPHRECERAYQLIADMNAKLREKSAHLSDYSDHDEDVYWVAVEDKTGLEVMRFRSHKWADDYVKHSHWDPSHVEERPMSQWVD